MAGIKQPILDILSRLAAISVHSQEGGSTSLYSRVWNNQLDFMKDGSGYVFPRPAAFIEVLTNFSIIGLGVRSADIGVRVHLVADYYNLDGTLDQDLLIFDLRDTIISPKYGLSQYCPTACGPLNCIGEEQDFSHDNVYHYILNFVCNFTDSKGSRYDPDSGFYISADIDINQHTDYVINN